MNSKSTKSPPFFTPLVLLVLSLHVLIARHYEKFFLIDGGPQYMYYFTKFSVGSPEIEQSAIIDTGSDTLAFPCDQCTSYDCGSHQDQRFFTKRSKTFSFDMHCPSKTYFRNYQVCQFTKSYAEGSSLSGFLAEDYIRFKNSKATNDPKLGKFNSQLPKDLRLKATFGCTSKETGLFKDQYADGIIGLDTASSLIKSIEVENSNTAEKRFSFGLCFHEKGGIMSVDLRNTNADDEKIVFLDKHIASRESPLSVPYAPHNNYYELQTIGFELGDRRITISPILMMIDSGTTFSHFPDEHADAIFQSLNLYCRKNRNSCGKMSKPNFNSDTCLELRLPDPTFNSLNDLYNSFPPIKVLFANANKPYIIWPKNYFYQEYNPNQEPGVFKVCMAIKGQEHGKIILGAFSMIDYYFYFDRKQQKILIFEENCFLRTNELLLKKERVLEDVLVYLGDKGIERRRELIVGMSAVVLVAVLVWWRRKRRGAKPVPDNLSVFLKSHSSESGMERYF